MAADISEGRTRANGLFLIGNGEDSDLKANSPRVKTTKRLTEGRVAGRPVTFFHDVDTKMYIVALVHGFPSKDILNQNRPFIPLRNNPLLVTSLKNSIVDMAAVTRKSAIAHCKIAKDLFAQWAAPISRETEYLLRHFDLTNRPLSLNRCSQATDRFFPKAYQLSYISPGSRNLCQGYKLSVTDFNNQPQDGNAGLVANVQAGVEEALDFLVVERQQDTECTSNPKTDAFAALPTPTITTFLDQKIQNAINGNGLAAPNAPGNAPAEPLWSTDRYFDNNWIQLMKEGQQQIMPRLLIKKSPDIRQWFEFLPNLANPAQSRFRCWLCRTFFKLAGISESRRDGFSNSTGKLHPNYFNNIRTLRQHGSSAKHVAVISALKAEGNLGLEDMKRAMSKKIERRNSFAKMTSMIRTVYASVRMNAPFNAHATLVNLQKLNGVNLGHRLDNRFDAAEMMMALSRNMHSQLMSYLQESNSVATGLLIDESTDNKNRNYLVVLFQIIEQGQPVVVFYKLIPLTHDASAQALKRAMLDSWREDNIYDYMKNSLLGVGTDGASTLTGRVSGLCQLLKQWATNDLVCVWCMAHRLALAGRWGIKESDYFLHLETVVNNIYNFYQNKAHKRKSYLYATAREAGVFLYEPSRVFETRWVDSERQAFMKTKRNWPVLVKDLEKIFNDNSFRPPDREKAGGIRNELVTPNFLLALHFSIDILDRLSQFSLRLQYTNGLIFDKYRKVRALVDELEGMKIRGAGDGDSLKKFKDEVECFGSMPSQDQPGQQINVQRKTGCSEYEIYNAENVIWKGVTLSKMGEVYTEFEIPQLEAIRGPTLTSLIDQIRSYFPYGDDLQYFGVFDPYQLPSDKSHLPSHGIADIQKVAFLLGMGGYEFEVATEWTELMTRFEADPTFDPSAVQKVGARKFWKRYLDDRHDFHLPPRIRTLLIKSMTIPFGTSDCERYVHTCMKNLARYACSKTSCSLSDPSA